MRVSAASAITGFYYVCVDFNPAQAALPTPSSPVAEESAGPSPTTTTANAITNPTNFVTKPDTPSPRSRRVSVNRGTRRAGRSASRGCPTNVATMSGFYFHQNSEP